jgi:hypothetical protein
MQINDIANEIREIIKARQQEIQLTFEEEGHIYTMADKNGFLRSDFPSVSKVLKAFYVPFDTQGNSYRMSNGDPEIQKQLLAEWAEKGRVATSTGSRTHYLMEIECVKKYGLNKEVRQPIYEVNEEQIARSDAMVEGGKKYLELMDSRNAVLLDTETVLGDPDFGYVGQPDKYWIVKSNEGYGFFVTDWKSNRPEKFVDKYGKKLLYPFHEYPDTALGHYYIQLPLYGRLIQKMLKGSKYENIKMLGSIVVLLKDDGSFEEFRVPGDVTKKVMNMNLNEFLKKIK